MGRAAPTLWQLARQTLGRAIRETGQAIDRVAIKTIMLSSTENLFHDEAVIYEDHWNRHRNLHPLIWSGRPVIAPGVAYVAPCSSLIGSVHVGAGSSIWYGSILRADECTAADTYERSDEELLDLGEDAVELSPDRFNDRTHHQGGAIIVGENTNIQDACIVTAKQSHCVIGNGVTVGHSAQLHSCTVGDYALIGMGSVLSQGAVVEEEVLIAAGAVVPADARIREGELWAGNPARKIRNLSARERERLHHQSSEYVKVALSHSHAEQLGGNLFQAAVTVVEEQQQEEDQSDLWHREEKILALQPGGNNAAADGDENEAEISRIKAPSEDEGKQAV